MINLEEVRNELVGREYNIIELSNELQGLGYEDICEFGNWFEILESRSVVVAVEDNWEEHILIEFEIVQENGIDEIIGATIVKVTDITEN